MEMMRESIFISAVRTFAKTFFGVLGLFIALIPLSFLIFSLSTGGELEEKTTLTILPDLNGNREVLPPSAPAILRINVHGFIGDDLLNGDMVENQLIDSRTGSLKDGRVKAILLHINSPGGTVTDADNSYRAILEYKKRYKVPVFAYVDGLCASGGMYIAASADKIFASPVSVVGSIGIISGPYFNLSQTMEKIGLQALTLTQGKNKDDLNPFRPWKEGEDASLKAITAVLYQHFVDIVTTARPQIDKEKLINDYGANVYTSMDAEKMGYVDNGNSDYASTMSALLKAANIDETKPYQVVQLVPKHKWLSEIMRNESPLITGKMKHSLTLGDQKERKSSGDYFSYLYVPGN